MVDIYKAQRGEIRNESHFTLPGDIEFVLASDYAALEAELKDVRLAVVRLKMGFDHIQAERDELKRRCEEMSAKRTLSKWRGVKMWKVPAIGESLIDIGTDQCVMSGRKFWREDLVIAHNNDIVALNHCADVLTDELIDLDKRVTSFCESLRNEGGDIFIGEKYIGLADTEGDATGIVDELKYGLAAAIAEGRNDG